MPQEMPLDIQWLVYALASNNALTIEDAQAIMASLPEPELTAFAEAVIGRITVGMQEADVNNVVEQMQEIVNYASEQAETGDQPPWNESVSPSEKPRRKRLHRPRKQQKSESVFSVSPDCDNEKTGEQEIVESESAGTKKGIIGRLLFIGLLVFLSPLVINLFLGGFIALANFSSCQREKEREAATRSASATSHRPAMPHAPTPVAEKKPEERKNAGDNGAALQTDRQDNTKTEENKEPPGFSEAEKKYRAAAEKGDINAQFRLGWCYAKGDGVIQDDRQMAYWWGKAAEQGFVKAQVNMGLCYVNGKGVPQSDFEAVKWYRKAADQGYPIAQFELGMCYTRGWGVARDCSKAFYWLQKAAMQGHAGAQHKLAFDYIHTSTQSIVPHNTAKGVYWLRKAAEQGHAGAQRALSILYFNGTGVPSNLNTARYWREKANNQEILDEQNKQGCIKLKWNRTFLE